MPHSLCACLTFAFVISLLSSAMRRTTHRWFTMTEDCQSTYVLSLHLYLYLSLPPYRPFLSGANFFLFLWSVFLRKRHVLCGIPSVLGNFGVPEFWCCSFTHTLSLYLLKLVILILFARWKKFWRKMCLIRRTCINRTLTFPKYSQLKGCRSQFWCCCCIDWCTSKNGRNHHRVCPFVCVCVIVRNGVAFLIFRLGHTLKAKGSGMEGPRIIRPSLSFPGCLPDAMRAWNWYF